MIQLALVAVLAGPSKGIRFHAFIREQAIVYSSWNGRESVNKIPEDHTGTLRAGPDHRVLISNSGRTALYRENKFLGAITDEDETTLIGWLGPNPVMDSKKGKFVWKQGPKNSVVREAIPANWMLVETNASGSLTFEMRDRQPAILVRRKNRQDVIMMLGVKARTLRALGPKYFVFDSLDSDASVYCVVDSERGFMSRVRLRADHLPVAGTGPNEAWLGARIGDKDHFQTQIWKLDLNSLDPTLAFTVPGEIEPIGVSDDHKWLIAWRTVAPHGRQDVVAVNLHSHRFKLLVKTWAFELARP